MLSSYVATEGERLDSIVNKVLGGVEEFERVLKSNPHLQGKLFLEQGDVVNFEVVIKKEFYVETASSSTAEHYTEESAKKESIKIAFKEPLKSANSEENLKALW
jgi:hypothetical protein